MLTPSSELDCALAAPTRRVENIVVKTGALAKEFIWHNPEASNWTHSLMDCGIGESDSDRLLVRASSSSIVGLGNCCKPKLQRMVAVCITDRSNSAGWIDPICRLNQQKQIDGWTETADANGF